MRSHAASTNARHTKLIYRKLCLRKHSHLSISLFETSSLEGYGYLGHPDVQGFSWGIIQWNFGMGTLKPLLLSMDQYLNQADPVVGPELRSLLLNNTDEQLRVWANAEWADTAKRSKWITYFANLGSIPGVQAIQREGFKNKYYSGSSATATQLGFHSARAIAEIADINVQNGGLSSGDVSAFQGAGWLGAERSSLGRSMAEQEQLLLLAKYAAVECSSSDWGFDVWYRKSAIATNGMAHGISFASVGFNDAPYDGYVWPFIRDTLSYTVNPGVNVWEHDDSGLPTNNLGPAASRGVNLRWSNGYYVIC